MNRFLSALCLLALLFPLLTLAGTRPNIAKAHAWVTINPLPDSGGQLDDETDDGYVQLSFEEQYNVSLRQNYVRSAIRILTDAGIQNMSEVSAHFDPSWQQLSFHTIRIIRSGQVIDQLDPYRIKTIQRESDREKFLYDGSMTALCILEDVRKGDIIDYSYTLTGSNPVLGKFYAVLETGFSIPLYQYYYKVVHPASRPLQIKAFGSNPVARVKRQGDETVYEWTAANVPAVRTGDELPSWYDPYPMVQVSEYSSWKEVSEWAMQLYGEHVAIQPGLRNKIADIQASGKTEEGKVAAALRFVQDDVRYLGMEMGINSHRPHDPNVIFRQRFGDCKDKSYLLCTMLKAMGIKARPVLIHTEQKKTLQHWLPSPSAFDHVTVQVLLHGKTYWFGPTSVNQRGPLSSISYPDYQCGLVVSDTTTGLSVIPLQEKSFTHVRETFTVPDMSGTAFLEVVTVYTGAGADATRDDFGNNSRYEIQQKYQAYYAGYFEKIRSDSLRYSDDEESGRLITREYYTIPEFWDSKEGKKRVSLSPFVINSVIPRPSASIDKHPFAISHPLHYKEELVIHLPEEWSSTESFDKVSCSAFQLLNSSSYENGTFRFVYEYQTLKDHVLPEEASAYTAALKELDDASGYEISTGNESMVFSPEEGSSPQSNSLPLGMGVAALAGFLAWLYRRR